MIIGLDVPKLSLKFLYNKKKNVQKTADTGINLFTLTFNNSIIVYLKSSQFTN